MDAIFRYELAVVDNQEVSLPAEHVLLAVAEGRGPSYHIDLWARVRSSGGNGVKRAFRIFGTGHPMPADGLDYVGTVVMADELVWHVFAVPAPSGLVFPAVLP